MYAEHRRRGAFAVAAALSVPLLYAPPARGATPRGAAAVDPLSAALGTPAPAGDAAAAANVEALVAEALAKHPSVAARAAAVEAAGHAEVRAGAWEPPRFGVGLMSVPVSRPGFGSFDMTGVELMLEEEL